MFAGRRSECRETLRKKEVSVLFTTESLADSRRSAIVRARVDSWPSRICLPSPQALEPQLRGVYESFGLNACQIGLIAHGQPKRDYYYQSRDRKSTRLNSSH